MEKVDTAYYDIIPKNSEADSTEMCRNIEGEDDDMEQRTATEKRVTKGIKVTKSILPPCGETSPAKCRKRKK
jgi:hypothetical protein